MYGQSTTLNIRGYTKYWPYAVKLRRMLLSFTHNSIVQSCMGSLFPFLKMYGQ